MRKFAALLGVAVLALWCVFPNTAQAAGSHALIQGSGSSWAANAVNQWIADVHNNGLQVSYTPNGSAQGRKDFANKTVDFGVSDIGYQGVDPASGQDDTSAGRNFAYLPVVAGGTALPYQIRVGGKLVTNLRLSGQTLTKIFTNQITNWNDPAITQDNNGRQLPNLPIIPVVHSEGSGDSFQFTAYMVHQFPSLYSSYGGNNPTEYYFRKGNQVAENGSDSVMNFITSAAANGAIGYDEYSYALAKGYPVAKLLNSAGYYTLPTQYNVAVALTKAQINMDKSSPNYLLQNLNDVYGYSDARTYPMSSYSYAIIPTAANDPTMTTAKRQTLADYLYVSICQGQQQMGPIGYSPLPINLVQASFDQMNKLHDADPGVALGNENVTTCHNPTFIAGQPSVNYLAQIAAQPPSCDKQGAGPCTGAVDTGQHNPGQGGGSSGGSGGGSNSGGTSNTVGGAKSGTPSGQPSGTAGTHIDPNTGQIVSNNAFGDSGDSSGNGAAGAAQAFDLPKSQSGSQEVALAVVAGLMFLALLIVPPLLGRYLDGRTKK